MTLGAAGVKITPEELLPQVYIPAKKGSLQIDLLAATRRNGLVAYELAPRLADVLLEIAAGNPVLALENYSYGLGPVWHYSVAMGYDLIEGRIVRHSGKVAFESMPFGAFEYLWKSDGHWSMIALPPDKLPASVKEKNYANAVSALENSGQVKNAHIAYKTLLKRWPNNLTGLLGLGNTAYALNDLEGAKSAFTAATIIHPESVAAFNNLAHVLLELGNYDAALDAAQRAFNMGGPMHETSEATLSEIRQKIADVASKK